MLHTAITLLFIFGAICSLSGILICAVQCVKAKNDLKEIRAILNKYKY